MSRPAQVEQQIERVKQLQAEMAEASAPVVTDPPTLPTPPIPPQEPVDPPVIDQTPATFTQEDIDRLEQRYRTLQGMHKADVTQLKAELNNAINSFEAYKAQVAAQQQQQPAPTPKKHVTDADVEEWGEAVEMARRAAREEAEAISLQREAALLNRIAELEQRTGYIQQTVVPAVQDMAYSREEQLRDTFWNTIDTQVPDWQTINATQAFKDWLLSEDQLTGVPRQQFLAQAQANYDAQRVVKFFNEWKRTAAGGQTPAPVTPQNNLQQYVAPGPARSTTPKEQKKKQWTRTEISEFYKDSMLGKYRDRPEEKKRIEADISLAAQEGRVS